MNKLYRIGKFVGSAAAVMKPLVFSLAIILFLRVTGLISYVSYASNWMILQSGFKDATEEKDARQDEFNFSFDIQDLAGNKVAFDQFRGKVIFLNLWATWCGPCRAEMAGIQRLYEKVDKEKIIFVMLSLDRDTDKQKVIAYLQKRKFTFQGFMPSGYLPDQLKVPSIPTTFIISKDGKIVRKEIGSMRYDTSRFQKFLEELSQ